MSITAALLLNRPVPLPRGAKSKVHKMDGPDRAEQLRLAARQRYWKNRDKRREQVKAWTEANKEKVRAYKKQWAAENREKARIAQKRYRLKKKMEAKNATE